jgi:2'-hydroxyisoflavone reductase
MPSSRRDFLQMSAAAGAALALGSTPRARAAGAARRPRAAAQRILILGGTGFLGPACMEAALAKGHAVTLFNSGRTEERRTGAGRPSVIPDGVEVLHGNRDPNKTADDRRLEGKPDAPRDPDSPKGLTQLGGKKWDAVIDTSGYWPRIVKASAELLAPNVRQYVFISTLSVYKANEKTGEDESAETGELADPSVEDFGPDFSNYGPGKAMSERAAEAAMPGRVTNVRPGFIVGQRDTSRRFIYWPTRTARGGEMIVPGKPTDPIQIIDVRDLAEWLVRLIETNTTGVFNATGPEDTLTMRAMVDGCKEGVGGDASFTWIDPEFLTAQGVPPQSFPLWIPPEGEAAGFHQRSIAKAVAAGLTFRPVSETARSTLEWYRSLPEDVQKAVVPPGVPAEKEAEVIKAWKEREGE